LEISEKDESGNAPSDALKKQFEITILEELEKEDDDTSRKLCWKMQKEISKPVLCVYKTPYEAFIELLKKLQYWTAGETVAIESIPVVPVQESTVRKRHENCAPLAYTRVIIADPE
jgi:hypothetical protein